jgi:hypothetical protein
MVEKPLISSVKWPESDETSQFDDGCNEKVLNLVNFIVTEQSL